MMFPEAQSLQTDRDSSNPDLQAHAPGRVNLIGEHTDYNDGFVFPVAIDLGVTVSAWHTDGQTELHSEEVGPGDEFNADLVQSRDVVGWSRYPAGVAWALRDHGRLPNLKFRVRSTLPTASGLSSSAALELAFATIWNEAAGINLSPLELALECQRAENQFVGVQCGAMDQLASTFGRAGHAMFIDTRNLGIQYFPIPADLKIVVCDTGKDRALAASAYNERRRECEAACEVLGRESLRNVTEIELEANKHLLDGVIYRRALHVVTENKRCQDFATALESGRLDWVRGLMNWSHDSLRNNYQVSSIELDTMVQTALRIDGCVGARMTGAGFGGACVALVESDRVDRFVSTAMEQYCLELPDARPVFLACEAADGARITRRRGQTGEKSEISGQTISRNMEDVERL